MMHKASLTLNGFNFEELFTATGLSRLDQQFLEFLSNCDPSLLQELVAMRTHISALSPVETSELLISCAKVLEEFLADLFNIKEAVIASQHLTTSHNPISVFKKYFVLRRAKKEAARKPDLPPFSELDAWLNVEIAASALTTNDKELATALLGLQYLKDTEKYAKEIERLGHWSIQALLTNEGQQATYGWTSFRIPERLDYSELVKKVQLADDAVGRLIAPPTQWRLRDGFKLTDPRMNAREIQDEVNYCIYCHDHEGDFCSKGFPVKKGEPALGYKKNPLDVTLTGCPLEEKISEMQLLKRDGHTLAALAMVMVDNPMCPATGHRICNDCMKSCIYQKQDPVNVPQIETRVLTDVLDLPWGVEIYDLLTRWNPLRAQQWAAKPYNGLKVMIAGMGPAGFTLAHHLLQEGFAIVGFDGLKIEPLSELLIKHPIYRYADLKEALDERLMAGFGGVAEYGITVRWDKNFLKLIYLSLMRRPYFQVFGGVRFGGTIKVEDAWEMGFDHFVVAVGAGLPKALPIPGSLATGMRQANDFLMALQLGNAAKKSSLTNLQIRLPAVVIGGGLTGVDTATELQAYYIAEVEKILERYEILLSHYDENTIYSQLDSNSKEILDEFIAHGKAIRQERVRARAANEYPNFIKLIHEWGGVTIAYRRSLHESPAYINNHEELKKALEEGIFYLEGLEPAAIALDHYGHTSALICHKRYRNENQEWVTSTEEIHIPARSILAATGTQPNTAYEFEHRGTFNRLNYQYQHYEDEDGQLTVAPGVSHCKEDQFGPFTSYHQADYRVSLIGDTHPVFHGSVVKAIASGMRTYPKILDILQDKLGKRGDDAEYKLFAEQMRHWFCASLSSIERKTKDVVELVIKAPLAAKHFQPGVFYRLQNFETNAQQLSNTLMQMEPLALVAAERDAGSHEITFMVRENSATAKLCALLKPGELLSLMGPTGVRTKIPIEQETALIIGNEFSLPFLLCYGSALREAGNRVIYCGLFKHKEDIYDLINMQNATDVSIWLTSEGDSVPLTRSQDFSGRAMGIDKVLTEYGENRLFGKAAPISLHDVDRVFVVGGPDLLQQFRQAQPLLKKYLLKNPKIFGSVYGNMQCMLKGVCAQCLQWQIDPETGQRTKAVFACSWQDQPLELIDIEHINARLAQNHLLDQLNNLWVDHLLATHPVDRV